MIFILERFNRAYAELSQISLDFHDLFTKVVNESLVPAIKSIFNSIGDLVDIFLRTILKQIESVDMMPYIKSMAPWIEASCDFIINILRELDLLYKECEDIMKTWPSLNDHLNRINTYLLDLKFSDTILELLHSLFLQIRSVFPESTEFCDKLYNYLKAKIAGKKVDDLQVLGDLFTILKNTSRHYYLFENILPNITFGLPKISFSLLNLLENSPTLHDLRLIGHILPSGGLISFDGKFVVYNTNCRLVIAQDTKNGNFTIFGNYKNGQLKVLSLVDGLTTIEIMDNGIAKLNGKAVNWPIISREIVIGAKQWNSYTIRSHNSDVEINCSNGLKNCQVSISYVFTGYIRGILGNGNGEIFDDFILPDGNIAESEETFFNAYGIGACGAKTAVSSVQNDNCLSMFAWDSPMTYAFNFVSPNAFKKMCDVYSKCEVAFTYASAAKLRHIPVILPVDCFKCEEKKEFGDEFSIKIPTNKADIIFVVDLDLSKQVLHDLVVQTISGIQNDLKDRNFNDVNMGIIGYSTKYSDPLIISGDLQNLDLHDLFYKVNESLYPRADEKAFELAMRYPFRSLATKTIIVIRSDGLVLNLGNIGRAVLYSGAAELRGILLQVVHPVSGLTDEVIGEEYCVHKN